MTADPTRLAEIAAKFQTDDWFGTEAGEAINHLIGTLTAAQARSREDAEIMRAAAIYLDNLENNMVRNNVDMRLDPCDAPSDMAATLRARADELEGRTDG